MMSDLKNPKLIYAKGAMFLIAGLLASAGLLLDRPDLKTLFLLALAVWCFCRFYYFCFYVIQYYVDSSFRFAGLISVGRYLARGRRGGGGG